MIDNENKAENTERHRICKTCDKMLNLEQFKITGKKILDDGTIIEYRLHTCPQCLTLKNKEYMKKYHKDNYTTRKKNIKV